MAETLRRQGQLPAPGLEGYTLDFSGDPDADEIDYCRSVGAHLGKTIHEMAPAHLPLSWYQDIARHFYDFPEFPNGGAMGLPIAESARANGSRVLLNGIGGDQWLCGSELCYAEAIAGWRGRELLNILCEDVRAAGLRTTLWRFLRFGIVPLLPEPNPASSPERLRKVAPKQYPWQGRVARRAYALPVRGRERKFSGSRYSARCGEWRSASNLLAFTTPTRIGD